MESINQYQFNIVAINSINRNNYYIFLFKFNEHKAMKTIRTCIYSKDIQRITGKSERASRKLISDIKKHQKKEPHHFITAEDFSSYTGIDIQIINQYL